MWNTLLKLYLQSSSYRLTVLNSIWSAGSVKKKPISNDIIYMFCNLDKGVGHFHQQLGMSYIAHIIFLYFITSK